MIALMLVLGLLLGWIMTWVSDVVPRFAVSELPDNLPPLRLPRPAVLVGLARLGRRISVGSDPGKPLPPWFWVHLGSELAGAVILGLVWQFSSHSIQVWIACLGCLYFGLVALIDLKYRLVLNVMTYPVILGLLAIDYFVILSDMRMVLLGGAFAFAIFAFTAFIQPGKLGGGDVKLALLIGVALGFPQVIIALLVGGGFGAAVSVWLLASKRATLKTTIPYAPFLCFGAVVALLLGWRL